MGGIGQSQMDIYHTVRKHGVSGGGKERESLEEMVRGERRDEEDEEEEEKKKKSTTGDIRREEEESRERWKDNRTEEENT